MLKLLLLAQVFISSEAENGVRYIQIDFPDWPRVVYGHRAEDHVLEQHVIDLGQPFTFYAGGSFIGLDRGDVGEFDVRLGCDGGPMIYQRSLHKETAAPFNSEDWQYAAFVRCRLIRVWLLARTTGLNEILNENTLRETGRGTDRATSRPHFGARLWTYPTTPTPDPDPNPNPNPNPNPDPANYVTLEEAGILDEGRSTNLARTLRFLMQELVWAGLRDLNYVATVCPSLCEGGSDAVFALTPKEMTDLAQLGANLNNEWLTKWVPRWGEVNRRCDDLGGEWCKVSNFARTTIANFELRVRSHLATSIAVGAPIANHPENGRSFDSIKGFCEWWSAQ